MGHGEGRDPAVSRAKRFGQQAHLGLTDYLLLYDIS
jgi:hypothetical protein